jgi:hypothetical protein
LSSWEVQILKVEQLLGFYRDPSTKILIVDLDSTILPAGSKCKIRKKTKHEIIG